MAICMIERIVFQSTKKNQQKKFTKCLIKYFIEIQTE